MRTSRRNATVLVALLIAGVLGGAALPSYADPRDISVGGVFICRITHDVSGYTSYQRAVQVNQRITQVLSKPEFSSKGAVVKVTADGPIALITVGNILVFTVTPEDASDTTVTPIALARGWAQKLAEGLSRALPGTKFYF